MLRSLMSADITDLEIFRKSMQKEAEKRGAKLTLLAFLIKASVNALKAYPIFNSSLSPDGDNLIMKSYYNVGFACDTPDGLVVPVVKDVQKKDVIDIAEDLGNLSEKARARKLKMDEMQGGCFTISSLRWNWWHKIYTLSLIALKLQYSVYLELLCNLSLTGVVKILKLGSCCRYHFRMTIEW